LGKGCKVGLCPLRAASLQILEAGTVTFSLARLPGHELKRPLLILGTSYTMTAISEMVRKYRS